MMSKQFCQLLLGVCLCCLVQVAVAQEEMKPDVVPKTKDRSPIEKLVLKEVRKEIRMICEIKFSLSRARYKKFFELDDDSCARLKVRSEELTNDFLESVTDNHILTTCLRMGEVGQGISGFEINGRKCVLEGSEGDQDVISPKLSMSLSLARILVQIERGLGGKTTTNLGYLRKLNVDSKRLLKSVLPDITDEDLASYTKHCNEEKLDRVASLILASLEVQLKLSEDQLEPARQWIRDSLDESMYKRGLLSASKAAVKKLPKSPEFLTDAQKKVLELIQAKKR